MNTQVETQDTQNLQFEEVETRIEQLLASNQYVDAISVLKSKEGLYKANAGYYYLVAKCYSKCLQWEQAVSYLEQALHYNPSEDTLFKIYYALVICAQKKQDAAAITTYFTRLEALKPHDLKVLDMKLQVLLGQKDFAAIVAEYNARKQGYALLSPKLYQITVTALLELKYFEDAERKAIEGINKYPKDKQLFSIIANYYLQAKKSSSLYRLCAAMLQYDATHIQAIILASTIDYERKNLDQMQALVDQGLRVDPSNADLLALKSLYFSHENKIIDAQECVEKALEINPNALSARASLARIKRYLCQHDEAIAVSQEAYDALSDEARHTKNSVMNTYNHSYHPTLDSEYIVNVFRQWGKDKEGLFVKRDFTNIADPNRKLRIGYVSADFRNHTSRFYYKPLFSNHNHDSVELYAYANVQVEDGSTEQFRGNFDYWRDIVSLNDQEVCEQIIADQIDILVDTTNHMSNCRLTLFAMKPAPVQATWLGSVWTTGLETMDYAIQDPYMVPEQEGNDALFVEQVARMQHSLFCYDTPDDAPEITSLPYDKNGYITFGYCGRTERLNQHVFKAWASLLNAIPNARLVLDYKRFVDDRTCTYFKELLVEHGIDANRLQLCCSTNKWDAYKPVDILLDSFPHSGGTMLFDSVWMGVPFVTFADRVPVGRIGSTILHTISLPELVTYSESEYLEKAIALASDIPRLRALREGMRERMLQSPLMDGKAFAKNMEDLYRNMWQKWCKEQQQNAA